MTERNVSQRLIVTGIVVVIGAILLYPPSQKLRPGLDIAGGTSLIFEIDTTDVEGIPDLAERVKTHLQKRVDPRGVYNLTWRVHGSNRIEVQMPLPPKGAAARREAYAEALEELFSQELRRGQIEQAIRAEGEGRDEALRALARGRADAALAAISGTDEASDRRRKAIEDVVGERERLLREAADRWDALLAAQAALERGPVEARLTGETPVPPGETPEPPTATGPETTQPATAPVTVTMEALEEAYRDAAELFEDAIDAVLAKNINRRRFQEILELDEKSAVRKSSLAHVLETHPDLADMISEVVAKHAVYRAGRQFLDGPADLKRLLRGAGKLEFRILALPSPENVTKYDRYRKQLKEGRQVVPGDEFGWFKIDNPLQFFNLDSPAQLKTLDYLRHGSYVLDKLGEDYYVLASLVAADGLLQGDKTQQRWTLKRARIDRDEHGRWCVRFTLDPIGGALFETLTRNNINKPLCILVDNIAYSAPNIQSAIRTDGVITGEFSLEKVNYLVQTMEGGTLPARLKDTPLSERTIGSSLGEKNRDFAVRAGMIGVLAVVGIMLGYYLLCGAIANVAMLLNVFLTLAVLSMLGARITLDGIAGLILSVGMAVDANVLIYERMREEKARGGSLRMAIKNGYDRAFSTIFDSNMTTLLTCVIIYYVGSEEVKGFGLTLGWGIVLNLFSAVFVTRALFDLLLRYNLIKDIKMLHLIGVPNIDWCSKAKFLVPVTALAAITGVALLFVRGGQNIFDIEFLGGVAAEFEVKEPSGRQPALDDVAIGNRIEEIAASLARDAGRLSEAVVEPLPGDAGGYAVRLEGVDGTRLLALLAEPLESENLLIRGGAAAAPGDAALILHVQPGVTQEQLTQRVRGQTGAVDQMVRNLARANVNAVLEVGGVVQRGLIWNVTTTATNMRLVEYALTAAIGDRMRVQPSVRFLLRGQEGKPYPITDRLLDAVVPGLPPGVNADLTDYLGGAAFYLEKLEPPQSVAALRERLDNMHFQPDFADMPRRRSEVIGVRRAEGTDEKGNPVYTEMVVVVVDPDIRYQDDPQTWLTALVQGEQKLIQTALSSEQTLRKVMQFKPQIATRATQQASMAVILSWIMIVAYVWIRFGRLSYGVGGVVGLIHDVLLALAFVGFSGWLAKTAVGRALLIEDFKINMTIVAALLTIIGFSINDTIVIFDRIRETRGRLGIVTPEIVNGAINQTLSRTILTAFTVFVVIAIAYVFGGSSIRGFNYCMLIGVLTGCYSTVAIASPLLLLRLRSERRAVRVA